MSSKNLYIPIFILFLILDTVAIYFDINVLRYFAKPGLMSVLILTLIQWAPYSSLRLHRYHMLGLIFSLSGDVLLQVNLFLPGLFSFLLAHVAYILLMISFRPIKSMKLFVMIFFLLSVAGVMLGKWLVPDNSPMLIPVIVYASTILTMGAIALLTAYKHSLILLGAGLFIISDFVLALGLFKSGLPHNGIIVMWTYALAQLSLFNGFVRYQKNELR